MESTNLLILTFIVGTIGALMLIYHRLNFWTRKGIPHVSPLQILGNTWSILFLKKMPIYDYLFYLYNLHPAAKYVGIMDFKRPVAVVRDPELIKDICVKYFDKFTDHGVTENTDPLFNKNLFSLHGDRWKEMRHTLSPSFTANKMKFMYQLISKTSFSFVNYFLKHPEEAVSVDMKDALQRYANDVIASTAFGISVNSIENKDNEFYFRGKDATKFFSFLRLIKLFIFQFCPRLMQLLGGSILSHETHQFFRKIVQQCVQVRKEQNIVRPDMIQLLLEAEENKKMEVSIDDIIAQGFLFFLAGFSTTSRLLCFVSYELAMNPDIQEKLRNEVDTLTKNEGSDISYETLSKMKYMDMVISETLRKYPPAAVLDRLCVKSFTFPKSTPESKEYTAEPNSLVWIPVYALHHDKKYFPNPEKFDPERFSDENKNQINPYVYIPFGIGPRKCLGTRFALMETKILFIHILQNFVLEKCKKTIHPIVFENVFNVGIKGDFAVKFQKRYS